MAQPDQLPPLAVWLDNKLESLTDLVRDQHGRIRDEMTRGFTQAGGRIDKIDETMRKLELALEAITTARKLEEQASLRRGTWAGIVAGFLFSALMQFAHWLFGKR